MGHQTLVSIGEKLDKSRGIGPGFDALRIVLALSVVGWHSFGISRHGVWLEGARFAWLYGFAILSMFFGLSGFLISASAQRLNLKNFLINRGLRIIPALFVEVVLSAFVLGLFFTSLSADSYLRNGQTYHYLTNVIGAMNFQLPGVFENNPVNAVNWSLWTVPYEYVCYGIMSALIILNIVRYPSLIAAGAALFAATGIALNAGGFHPHQGQGGIVEKVAYFLFTDRGSYLIISFMLGISAYLWRFRIPYSHSLALISFLICAAVSAMEPIHNYPMTAAIVSVPIVYLTAYIGVSRIPTPSYVRKGDYSYGVYLYGMPIQQMMISILPSIESPFLQYLASAPIIIAFAALSWHYIEKPVLGARKKFSFVARERDLGDHNLTSEQPEAKAQASAFS